MSDSTQPTGERRVVRRWRPDPRPSDTAVTVGAVVVSVIGALAFVATILWDLGVAAQGTALALALLGLALALRRGFATTYDQVEAEQPRPVRPPPLGEEGGLARRPLLIRLVGGAAALVGLASLAPLIGLGRPGVELARVTHWQEGVRLLDHRGQPVVPEEVPDEGIATLWPEDAPRTELGTVVLVRLPNGRAEAPTRTEWVVDGLVAYSKICTHAGCPVDMFNTDTGVMLCPCHQGQFDAVRGAQPTFGPVSRPLPQLPLGVNDDGELIALGDFVDEPGPSAG